MHVIVYIINKRPLSVLLLRRCAARRDGHLALRGSPLCYVSPDGGKKNLKIIICLNVNRLSSRRGETQRGAFLIRKLIIFVLLLI